MRPTHFGRAMAAASTAAVLATVLAACGGADESAPGAGAPLSADQQVFEAEHLHGGSFTLAYNLPYGGGTLDSSTNYFYTASSGVLNASPLTAGREIETPTYASLNAALNVPPSSSATRYLVAGQIDVRSRGASHVVSYTGGAIRIDDLADDGTTVVQSSLLFDLSEFPLSGAMLNSPAEFLAAYPIEDWTGDNNFATGATWQAGAAYTTRHASLIGDTYLVTDCATVIPLVVTLGTSPTPCQSQATLDSVFPVRLLDANKHPFEVDFASDGSIATVAGIRMWIATQPLPFAQRPTQGYRVFFEMNGNVYSGVLEKDGAPFRYTLQDGSIVDYSIAMNATAAASVGQALIVSATPGSQAGTPQQLATVNVFGIGGQGPNGSLAPADLRAYYNAPAGLDGSGQTIAVVGAPSSGNVAADLNAYSAYFNLPQCNTANPCFQNIDLSNGLAGTPGAPWGIEPEIDTQMVHSMAPGATIILVTAASNTDHDLLAAINYAAALPGVTAVSMSFGMSPSSSAKLAEDQLLAGFQSAQGVIFLASSGDRGNNGTAASYPAASPYVTAVGGTRVTSVSRTGSPPGEAAWEFSGGGTGYAAMPAWQSSYLAATGNPLAGGMRAVPDVAAVADFANSAVAVFYKQRWVMTGGTSVSSPIWGGVSALAGQSLARSGRSLAAAVKASAGGFNGLLYRAAALQTSAGGPFHDIVSGSSNLSASPCSLCLAGPGYDTVTGLGSPDVTQLLATF